MASHIEYGYDLITALRRSNPQERLHRVQYARGVLDVVSLLPPVHASAGLFAARAQVLAWLVEDLIMEVDTRSLHLWAIDYGVDLDLVAAEVKRAYGWTGRPPEGVQ